MRGAGPVWREACVARGAAGFGWRAWPGLSWRARPGVGWLGSGWEALRVRAGLAGCAVAVASVAHAAGGAVKLAIIVVDSGLVVVLVHYRPPNSPRSPNPPRKS